MPDNERARLLDRLAELNRGDPLLAALCATAGTAQLAEVVARLEADANPPGGRLAAIWADCDGDAVIVGDDDQDDDGSGDIE